MTLQEQLMGKRVWSSFQLFREIAQDGTTTWRVKQKEVYGWIVGFRSLQLGRIVTHREEESNYGAHTVYLWKNKGAIEACLIATHPRRRPIYVPPEFVRDRAGKFYLPRRG
jgi:hypothetical protein